MRRRADTGLKREDKRLRAFSAKKKGRGSLPLPDSFLQPGLVQNELLDCLLGDPPDAAIPVALELAAAQQRVQCVVSDPQRFSGLFGGQDIGVFLKHLLTLLADAVTLTVGTGARINRAGAA